MDDHDQRRGETSRTLYSALRCESMLRWPIFEGIISEDDSQIESFILEFGTDMTDDGLNQPNDSSMINGPGIQEDAFVPLCRKFLTHVHPRNPFLEGNELIAYAKQAAEHGIKWDAPSVSRSLDALADSLAPEKTPAMERGKRTGGTGEPLEQRVFWSCFKAENEILPTLGLRPSGLEDFTYPDSFPAPPSTLSTTRTITTTTSVNETSASPSEYTWSPIPDPQQRLEEERSWLYYLAEISLRRTIKNTQYTPISHPLFNSPNTTTRTTNSPSTSKVASKDGANRPLRPLLYCVLHGARGRSQGREGQRLPTHVQTEEYPTNPRVIHLAQKAVDTCAAMIVKSAHHHRHGGSWFVARRAGEFSCAVMVLAAVVGAENYPVKPPQIGLLSYGLR
ncbi:C6 zinc finger domain-containing protein [Colletotrichum salicis]|uniref:C6 zinc finger domain-containing protein n=1 Tax=Colletotrichum salicis TaxID=1209931 RepID=A0A135ULI8_9PEZI|nr:C6 zinc finger domain-containing protein [Colletotrichum salicis]